MLKNRILIALAGLSFMNLNATEEQTVTVGHYQVTEVIIPCDSTENEPSPSSHQETEI
jgi:hypothetical protein